MRAFFSGVIDSLDQLICDQVSSFAIGESVASYDSNPRIAGNVEEVALLDIFRRLAIKQRRALLDLLSSE